MDVEHKDRNLSNEIFNFYILPEKDLVKLLGEWGEESGQRQDETSQDGRQSGRLATTQGHDQRCPQPAAT